MISLGIDIGSTGCKCVAFREDGTQLALSYVEYPVLAGTANMNPESLTFYAFKVLSDCVANIENKGEIIAITVSSFGESFVPVDENGQALSDILMYFGNNETEEFSDLVEKVGAEKFMRIARIMPDASYSLSKMLCIQKMAERPVWKYLFIAGYICYQLSGVPCTDESLACRSLLYDVEKRCWSKELTDACGIALDTLPEVVPTGTKVGTLLPKLAGKLGLSSDVPVVIGAHDQIVNALGVGVHNPGDAVDSSGTCECITPLFSSVPDDLGLQQNNFACVPYLENTGYVTYAFNISAGSVVRWYRDTMGLLQKEQAKIQDESAYDLFNKTAPTVPTNLMVMPFLQGMGGTPETDSNATGMIAGLTTQTRLCDIYRAILEGITFEMRYIQEKLWENGIRFNKLYACGGGAKSSLWLQIKADVLGCDIIPVQAEENGAMGSAILGIAAVTGKSVFEVAKPFWHYDKTIKPNPDHQKIYDQKYACYRKMRQQYRQYSLVNDK